MAEQKRPPEQLKRSELIAALEQSRLELSDDLLDLRDSLSVTRQLRSNYQRNTGVWIGAGALLGFLLARPLFRIGTKGKGKKKGAQDSIGKVTRLGGAVAGLTAFAGKNASKMIIPLARFAITSYIGKLFADKVVDEKSDPSE